MWRQSEGGTEEFVAGYDWISYEIDPAGIRVTEEVAVALPLPGTRQSSSDGSIHEESGRAMQILKRNAGDWKTVSIPSAPAW